MSERDDQFVEAAQQKALMESLMRHDGWKMLVENINAQVDERTKKLDAPLLSADGVYIQEYTKGARQAFKFIKSLPNTIATQAAAVVDAINAEIEENEDGEGEASDTDESTSERSDE